MTSCWSRSPSAPHRGSAAPTAKLESIGQLTGRRGARLQQPADRGARQSRACCASGCRTIPRVERLLDGATQGAQRGAALTQRLLALPGAGRPAARGRPISPSWCAAWPICCSIARPDHRHRLRPAGRPAAGLGEITARSSSPCSILRSNARDAMPDGGADDFALSRAGARGARSRGRPSIKLCVSDTGCGMDPQTLGRAIEPFFSTKEVGKGTGLGLSMIQGSAAAAQGRAQAAEAGVGRGTRAGLWLPVANGAAAAAAVDSQPEADVSKRQVRRCSSSTTTS